MKTLPSLLTPFVRPDAVGAILAVPPSVKSKPAQQIHIAQAAVRDRGRRVLAVAPLQVR